MNKTKKMKVNRRVTKMANFILDSNVAKVCTIDGYENLDFLCAKVVNSQTNEVLWVDFNEDGFLSSGYRFYSPLGRSEKEKQEYLHAYSCDFYGTLWDVGQALRNWAFNWKTGGLKGSGYTRPKFGNTRHRRCYRLRMKEYEMQHTYSYLFYDKDGKVYEMD